MGKSVKPPKKYIAVGSKGKKYETKSPFSEDIRMNGKPIDAKIMMDKGFTYVLYKNKKYLVDIIEKNQNKYQVLLNGVSYSFTIETPLSYKRRKFLDKSKQAVKVDYITAPMPGKIVDILVEENAEINEGDPIITLEAMKMQNEIVSHVSGTVQKILVKNEDSVMKDDIMIEIKIG